MDDSTEEIINRIEDGQNGWMEACELGTPVSGRIYAAEGYFYKID